jgi:hypothetical protein
MRKNKFDMVLAIKTKLLKEVVQNVLGRNVDTTGREASLVEARFIYFHILRDKEKMTYEGIGNSVSMNHASVLHGYNKTKQWMIVDLEFRKKYLEVLCCYLSSLSENDDQEKLEQEVRDIEQKLQQKLEDTLSGVKRPMRRSGDAYDRMHTIIDKVPDDKAENLLERLEAIYGMMKKDLTRKTV